MNLTTPDVDRSAPGSDGAGSPTLIAVFVVVALAGVALSAAVATGPAILDGRWAILARIALWGLAWAVAVALALRLPPRVALVLVLGAGLALRLAALAGPPPTSDDLFRYSWDAKVQAAGISPYRYQPEADELVGLRDSWLWPDDAVCADIDRDPGCTRINRPAEPTIYPPLAQLWFSVVHALSPDDARYTPWQVAGLVTEMGVAALLVIALGRWGVDRRWCALYVLCPAPVLEFVHNGHVDGLAVVLMVLALVVVAPRPGYGRSSPAWRQVGAGALLGAAAMVKLYPAVLLLALVGVAGTRRLPVLIRAGAGALAVAALAYLPHVVAVGWRVLGFLPGYLVEEDYADGGRFLIASAVGLPPWAAGVVSAVAVVAVLAWVVIRRPPPPVASAVLLGAGLLAASPVQPWYAVTLLAVATVAGQWRWVAVLAAGYPYFFAIVLDFPHTEGLGQLTYGAALVTVVGAGILRRRRRLSATGESPLPASPDRPSSPLVSGPAP